MCTLGCTNPNKCRSTALHTLDHLHPKWDPRLPNPLPPAPQPTTHHPNYLHNPPIPPDVPFDPDITTPGPMANSFHIFASPEIMSQRPMHHLPCPHPPSPPLQIYIAKCAAGLGSEEAITGIGVWFTPDDPRNTSL